MEYARVENDAVVERREIENIPAHKAHLWRPVVYEGDGPIEQRILEPDKLRVVRSDFPLSDIKETLKRRVDDDAEVCRLRFITPGSGMAMTYQEKFSQAQAVQDLGIDAADSMTDANAAQQFPTLFASVGIEANTLYACAELVIERYELFAQVSGLIESARLGGKKAISDASDAAAARAAYEAITWPQP